MLTLKENDKIGTYTVHYLIKGGDDTGTYKVTDESGTPRFMKFFDKEALPEKLLLDGEPLEIVNSRKVQHKNIVSRVDDGEQTIEGKSYAYLITDFLRGSLLSEMLENSRTLSVSVALDIMKSVLEGLAYLHDAGLNHNDLTPRNILLEEKGPDEFVPRIIDLGHLCPSRSGAAPFKLEDLDLLYCAPEALSGFYGPVADVFSAAAVLYTMICGKVPWACELPSGSTYQERKKRVRAARKEDLDVAALSAAGADENLVAVLVAGLALDEDKRASLEAFVKGICGEDISALMGPTKNTSSRTGSETSTRGKTESEVSVEIKKVSGGGFADVAGMEDLKASLTNRIIWVLRDREKAAKYRLTPPNGMILYGPPGCGKTFFAQKFAEETQFNFVLVNGSDLGSIYVHGTQGKIAELFRDAEKKSPTIICFDEFDSFVPSRSGPASEHRSDEVNEFLAQLNNCSKKGIFVIGTTNRIDLIDPAVLRKGRMDLHVEIPAPDEKTRAQIFALHLKDRPMAEDVDLAELAAMTDHYAAADVAFIVNEAAMTAALADELISQKHLVNSIKSNKSSLQSERSMAKIGF